MKEFLRKTITGANVLILLCLTSYCGGGKGEDNSALLALLGPQTTSSTTTVTFGEAEIIWAETNIQTTSDSQNASPGVSGGDPSLPDLMVYLITGGRKVEVKPGEDVSQKLKAQVANFGGILANGSRPAQEGYMVDLILSQDSVVPEGYAPYFPDFKEDVLLGGGRISNTPDLLPGTLAYVSEGSNIIPKNVPPGDYNLCARVDAGSKVAESNEQNNTVCVPITVQPSEPLPDLIIPRASIYPSGMKCRAGKPLLYVTAEIKNIGQGPSPKRLDVGLFTVLHEKSERWENGGTQIESIEPGTWGNGVGLESIQPGETVTVTLSISHLNVDSYYMEGKHTFALRANLGNWIQESNVQNNKYSKKTIEYTIPEGFCKSHPG
ncbi:CARDB domain-containing protein [Leptospira alstonii]|uniref:CARDB domain protein n=2 Tax=Leptospira alstonii TaxID=28452 RepID=M6CPQ0_9LEPT|nr:CARDB domain-containing protein [Leptospira alstonii]EMJ93912.1 CARDB domain protein [Leptospira alstonii serovar Sichuan str. 79601]EQA78866.1 CARDB domain protein [Leptospira alstonii serovar Pingchang str. 80-412]